MAGYGEPIQRQLDRTRRAKEAAAEAEASVERYRLQRENEQLRGEAAQLHQQARDAAVKHAADLAGAAARGAMAAAAALKPAALAAPAETPRQAELRQLIEAGKASGREKIEYGLSRERPGEPAPAKQPPAQADQQATAQPADWSGKSPVELIGMGLEQLKPDRAGP